MNLLDKLNISRAVKSLLKGELVVVPTETVFGIIGNAFDKNAYKITEDVFFENMHYRTDIGEKGLKYEK